MKHQLSDEDLERAERQDIFGEPTDDPENKVVGTTGGIMAWLSPAEKDELESVL